MIICLLGSVSKRVVSLVSAVYGCLNIILNIVFFSSTVLKSIFPFCISAIILAEYVPKPVPLSLLAVTYLSNNLSLIFGSIVPSLYILMARSVSCSSMAIVTSVFSGDASIAFLMRLHRIE